MIVASLVLAPMPNQTIVCQSGNAYQSDANGIMRNIASVADLADLSAAGCAVLNTPPGEMLMKLSSANFNSTGDQVFTAYFNGKFRIRRITALNTSVNGMSTAAGGIYTAASKSGTAIVAAGQVYTGLTNALTALDLTLAVPNLVLASGTPLYLSLTTGQGAPATADLYAFGDVYG